MIHTPAAGHPFLICKVASRTPTVDGCIIRFDAKKLIKSKSITLPVDHPGMDYMRSCSRPFIDHPVGKVHGRIFHVNGANYSTKAEADIAGREHDL